MISFKGLLAAGAAATALAASGAAASTIVIDDFTDSQLVQDLPGNFPNSSVISGGMFGGTRYLEAGNADGITSGTQLNSQSGRLTFDNSSGTNGVGYIVYDGTTDRSAATNTDIGVAVNTSGLSENILLDTEGSTFFSFDLNNFNPGSGGSTALFSAYAWDTAGNLAMFDEIVGGAPISPNLFLDEFSGDAIDWTQVGALAFKVDSQPGTSSLLGGAAFGGDNFDGTVGAISVGTVPLPASVLMLMSGLGLFFGFSTVSARRPSKA